jgi:transcriptional regulator GlxA family with amidase domain
LQGHLGILAVENLEGNLRLSDLAQEAKISTSHLIRSFRQSTGKTPYQYLLHQRIERAQSLMRNDRTPSTEVALASGFAAITNRCADRENVTPRNTDEWLGN